MTLCVDLLGVDSVDPAVFSPVVLAVSGVEADDLILFSLDEHTLNVYNFFCFEGANTTVQLICSALIRQKGQLNFAEKHVLQTTLEQSPLLKSNKPIQNPPILSAFRSSPHPQNFPSSVALFFAFPVIMLKTISY